MCLAFQVFEQDGVEKAHAKELEDALRELEADFKEKERGLIDRRSKQAERESQMSDAKKERKDTDARVRWVLNIRAGVGHC